MTGLHGRPDAAELVAAVADFLDGEVREATSGSVNFHARVAANALRMVHRELLSADAAGSVLAAVRDLGYPGEAELAAAIRRGDLDDRPQEVTAALRTLVAHRLDAAHPGYR